MKRNTNHLHDFKRTRACLCERVVVPRVFADKFSVLDGTDWLTGHQFNKRTNTNPRSRGRKNGEENEKKRIEVTGFRVWETDCVADVFECALTRTQTIHWTSVNSNDRWHSGWCCRACWSVLFSSDFISFFLIRDLNSIWSSRPMINFSKLLLHFTFVGSTNLQHWKQSIRNLFDRIKCIDNKSTINDWNAATRKYTHKAKCSIFHFRNDQNNEKKWINSKIRHAHLNACHFSLQMHFNDGTRRTVQETNSVILLPVTYKKSRFFWMCSPIVTCQWIVPAIGINGNVDTIDECVGNRVSMVTFNNETKTHNAVVRH